MRNACGTSRSYCSGHDRAVVAWVASTFVAADFDEPDRAGYIRGGGGVAIDPARLLRVMLGVILVVLAVLAVVLLTGVIQKHSRDSRLKAHGVNVDVTVTSCLGMASGTGITDVGFRCSGTFTLDGFRHTDVIMGSRANHQIGERIIGIADPRSPADLSTQAAVLATHVSWSGLLVPAIPALLFVIIAALGVHALSWSRRA
jgi:hypothetical protein